jgi:hypothetical protein
MIRKKNIGDKNDSLIFSCFLLLIITNKISFVKGMAETKTVSTRTHGTA